MHSQLQRRFRHKAASDWRLRVHTVSGSRQTSCPERPSESASRAPYQRDKRFLSTVGRVTGLGIAALLAACSSNSAADPLNQEVATVVRGPLRVSVTEDASMEAVRETKILNQMEGRATTIIWLIDEGTRVKQGDVLAQLDASKQESQVTDQEIKVERAKSRLVAATADLVILRKQSDSDFDGATNSSIFAEMDLEKFSGSLLENGAREMGEQEQEVKQELAEIQLAEAELDLAREDYEWSEILQAQDFITATQLERDRLSYEGKRNRFEAAKNKLDILLSFTHQRTSLELEHERADTRLALARTKTDNQARIAQAGADLRSRKREVTLQTERLEHLQKQIEHSVVLAPHEGIVVYGGRRSRWHRKRGIQEGGTVRKGQILITIPDTSRMRAELSINQALINHVKIGQRAIVRAGANQPVAGVVRHRAPLPIPSRYRGNPDLKLFQTSIEIIKDNEDGRMRPKQPAKVEIIIEMLEDELTMPIRAVRHQRAASYVWLKTQDGPVATRVEFDQRNATHIVVRKGLDEGDQVFLEDPEGMRAPEFEQPIGDGSRFGDSTSPRRAFLTALEARRPDLYKQLRADAANWTDPGFIAQFSIHPRIESAYCELLGKKSAQPARPGKPGKLIP